MVQPAHPRQRYDPRGARGARRDRSAHRRVLAEPEMAPVNVIPGDVLPDEPNGVRLPEHDDMVQKFPPDAADPAFCHPGQASRSATKSRGNVSITPNLRGRRPGSQEDASAATT